MSVAGLVLAAGLSRRMGRPKMLLPWGQTTVLGQVVFTLAAAGLPDVVVVTGAEREAVEGLVGEWAQSLSVRAAFNAQFSNGEMLTSLQVGLAALGPEVESALLALGDQPQIRVGSVQEALGAWQAARERIVIPSVNQRRGHPIVLPRRLWAEIASLPPGATLRDVLNAHAQEILYIPADESVLMDLDTPEAYEKHLKSAC